MKEELLINLDYYIMKLSNEIDKEFISNIIKELILVKSFLIMEENDKKEIEKSTGIYYKEKDLIDKGLFLIEKLEEIENS